MLDLVGMGLLRGFNFFTNNACLHYQLISSDNVERCFSIIIHNSSLSAVPYYYIIYCIIVD
jgi:hypothetical protein